MTELTAPTPAGTPAEPYEVENTTRASERFTDVLPATYDEKDDMDLLKEQLKRRKKPIYAGLAFLCVVVIGVSIAVTSGGDATKVNTGTGVSETPAPTTSEPTVDDSVAGGVHGADLTPSTTPPTSSTGSAANEAGDLDPNQSATNTSSPDSTTPAPTTEAPTPAPTDGPILPYKAVDFNWKDTSNWQYSSGAGIPGGMFSDDGIKLTSANSPQPIRTKMGWGGEKIVYFEWERSATSDTNIWMLNTKIREQFGANNGWPYYGEIDIFEMFTQDAALHPSYDYKGFMGFSDVASYGQLTLHYGPDKDHPCFCPSSPAKSSWYSGGAPLTSGCTAQFANTPKNSMATIWGSDGNGKYLQLYQNPTITKGGKINGQQTYDIQPGGVVTPKIYNNANLFWGTPVSAACAAGGGHNAATGFPFFEEFYITLEEQKKNDGSAWFKVNNIQIFRK